MPITCVPITIENVDSYVAKLDDYGARVPLEHRCDTAMQSLPNEKSVRTFAGLSSAYALDDEDGKMVGLCLVRSHGDTVVLRSYSVSDIDRFDEISMELARALYRHGYVTAIGAPRGLFKDLLDQLPGVEPGGGTAVRLSLG